MSSVLYQKYRAQNFDELYGQENVVRLLKNAVKRNKIAQAYLFVGSRGTGKTSTARILAKAINCLNPQVDGNPCNECENCKSITDGRFLDLIEIDAASNRGIDQIRELKEKIEFSPSEGKYKVYIIDEVHMLTTEAFNALLKTLEEPPAHVVFILATTDVYKLPPTILSRCQRYDFRLGTDEEIRNLIKKVLKNEKISMSDEAVNIIVRKAEGSYRDALSILDVVYSGQDVKDNEITIEEVRRVLGLPDSEKVILLLKYLIEGNGSKCLDILNSLEESGTNLQQFTEYVLDVLEEILSEKIKGDVSKEYKFIQQCDIHTVHKLINLFLEAENRIKYAGNQLLVLEMIIPEMMKPTANTEIAMINKDVKNKIKKQEGNEEKVIESGSENSVSAVSCEISVNEIKAKWDTFITEIRPYNGHLYAFLGGANIVSFEKGVINLEVPFQFHKERIEIPKSRNIISEVFNRVYGTTCNVSCKVNASIKPVDKSDADFVLRNLPASDKSKEKKKGDPTVKNFNKKIEAIFDGV
ncbi:MAG TPA: DNA polymerase III subunit gamma/tau [Candidatus Dojkabacteria bacterium]|nr:DNA polymerase III subunit gamma/tau [Candidatus Dojkabacteria bacterium]